VCALRKVGEFLSESLSGKVLELQLQAGLGIGNKPSFFIAEELGVLESIWLSQTLASIPGLKLSAQQTILPLPQHHPLQNVDAKPSFHLVRLFRILLSQPRYNVEVDGMGL